ncbi:MAG: stage II sporulation protein P, partial [Eubacteriales bacterium]
YRKGRGMEFMKRRVELPGYEQPPLIGQEEIRDLGREFESRRARRVKKWSYLYAATVICVTAVVVALLVVGIGAGKDKTKSDALFSQSSVQNAAGFIISNEFRDLSGGVSTNGKESPTEDRGRLFDVITGVIIPKKEDSKQVSGNTGDNVQTLESLYSFDYSKVPQGETAIIPMDLSLSSSGSTYIYNSTGYSPDVQALLSGDLGETVSPGYISTKQGEPLVLIVHTHGTEAYSPDGAISYLDDGGEIARSGDIEENVVSVGAVISEVLNKNGIPSVHCTVMHDQIQYKDSYARAEETIREYLKKYPSIKLVIDVHRDSVIKSTGELVRPVTLADSKAAAQVMCVVGSDWGGDSCPSWQKNLSLALKLRDRLNGKYTNLCRPVSLRSSTYNQELAPYSLLLEVGASGNNIDEAKHSAKLVAQELCELIKTL